MLWNGEFEQGMNLVDKKALEESRKSFKDHINSSNLDDLMVKDEREDESPSNSGIK